MRLRTQVVLVLGALVFLASAGVAVHGAHADRVTCRRVERTASPQGDPSTFPIVALPGPVRDLDGAVPGRFRFERDLGAFRMRYELSPDAWRWGLGRATLADPRACGEDALGIEVPTPSSDVVLRRVPGDVYLLTGNAPLPAMDVAFRSAPAGSVLVWSGLAAVAASLAALVVLAGAWLATWTARRRVARLATWREGVVATSDTVVPADGGGALFVRGGGVAPGTPVLFSPPRAGDPYRSALTTVDVHSGTRTDLDAWRERRRRLAHFLVFVSIAAGVASLALAFF